MPSQRTTQHLLLLAVACTSVATAFLPVSLNPKTELNFDETPSAVATYRLTDLAAKRKRRRRQDGPSTEAKGAEEISGFDTDESDELPDFELIEEMEEQESAKKPVVQVDPDVITPAMMGNADKPVRSVKDLISDRDLESKFEFEEAEDSDLPDLIEMARSQNRGVDGTVGKKKARQAQRKAAAIAANQADGDEEGLFSNLPFISNDDGEVQPIKVLEAGAWGGIFLLVAWEIYLNSPFFDRAAPLAPVVFENLTL